MQKRNLSCELKPFGNVNCEGKQLPKEPAVSAVLDNIPPEKIAEFQAYARKLRKKFPTMKPARLQRKVAEHFKVKLT